MTQSHSARVKELEARLPRRPLAQTGMPEVDEWWNHGKTYPSDPEMFLSLNIISVVIFCGPFGDFDDPSWLITDKQVETLDIFWDGAGQTPTSFRIAQCGGHHALIYVWLPSFGNFVLEYFICKFPSFLWKGPILLTKLISFISIPPPISAEKKVQLLSAREALAEATWEIIFL